MRYKFNIYLKNLVAILAKLLKVFYEKINN